MTTCACWISLSGNIIHNFTYFCQNCTLTLLATLNNNNHFIFPAPRIFWLFGPTNETYKGLVIFVLPMPWHKGPSGSALFKFEPQFAWTLFPLCEKAGKSSSVSRLVLRKNLALHCSKFQLSWGKRTWVENRCMNYFSYFKKKIKSAQHINTIWFLYGLCMFEYECYTSGIKLQNRLSRIQTNVSGQVEALTSLIKIVYY